MKVISITDFLAEGEKEAVSLQNLSIATGLPERIVKRTVLEARLNGELILSNENGYFLPADNADITEYVNRRKASISTSRKALKPFIKALQGR